MSLKTENLAILLTDIAGFTETTAKQSRAANERLLATHNRILLPIVKRFKGRHVKSIGDALLLVFRSPTDAMLCAMAMQDALFEYNRNSPKDQQIHLRVAASLGEVRVSRGDVFGEPVNITSRIESITPADEIYMSEAVYMAMNKAEVPSQEVGWRELKGVSGQIRIFNIPRFATPRLVPQDVMAAEDMSDLVYPYGGAHLSGQAASAEGIVQRLARSRATRAALVVMGLVPVLLVAGVIGKKIMASRTESPPLVANVVTPPPIPVPAPPAIQPESKPAPVVEARPEPKPVPKMAEPRPVPKPTPKPAPKPVARPEPKPAPKPVVQNAKTTTPARYEKEFDLKSDAPPPTVGVLADRVTRLSEAKRAYKDDRMTKDEYKRAVARIKGLIQKEVDDAKRDYKSDRISRKEYKDRIEAIEARYK